MSNRNENHMHICFDARSTDEGMARMVVSAFMMDMNPTLEQLADVKTAVSEAVTNAIVHGYSQAEQQVELVCDQIDGNLQIMVIDHGVGIEDVQSAMQPFYTSKPELERSGMGFAFMQAFMDNVSVESQPGVGTKVILQKYIKGAHE